MYATYLEMEIASEAQKRTSLSIQKANDLYNRLKNLSPQNAQVLVHSGMLKTVTNTFERQEFIKNDDDMTQDISTLLNTSVWTTEPDKATALAAMTTTMTGGFGGNSKHNMSLNLGLNTTRNFS